MSDINLDFIVSNNSINFTVEPNDITFTPSDVQLNILTGGLGVPGGSAGELQFNSGAALGGIPTATYNGSNVIFSNINNLKIAGGTNGYVLNTDGTGNLSWVSVSTSNNANYANYANFAGQAFGMNASVSNVKITGGTNGYVLQTDGTGNLTWTAQTGGSGNGVPGGSNTQIQYNDSGSFGGNVGFTFNEISGDVDVPGNVSASYFIGDGSQLTGIDFTSITNGNSNVSVAGNGNVTTSVAGNANILIVTGTGSNINGYLTVVGTTSIQQAKEKVTANAIGSTGIVNFDILSSAILLKTANASSNFDINVRGNSTITLNSVMSNNESLTCTYINKLGASTYYATSLYIDSVAQSVKWDTAGGPPSTGTTLGYDAYTFNILKTGANTYTVFGTRLGYL